MNGLANNGKVIGLWSDYILNPRNIGTRIKSIVSRSFRDSFVPYLCRPKVSPFEEVENRVDVLASILVDQKGMEWEEARERVYEIFTKWILKNER